MALPERWKNKIVPSDPSDEIMELQMGPSHPASHGTIKFNLKLDGERIVDCDVEVIFLYPWAVELRHLGMFGFVEAFIFIAILLVGLLYAWQRGALDWD